MSVSVAALSAFTSDGVDAVVSVTVVMIIVVVLGVAVAGFGTGSVADPAPGCSTAGPAPPAGHLSSVSLLRRPRGVLGLDRHMRRHGTGSILRGVAGARVLQVHAVGARAGSVCCTDGDDAPAADTRHSFSHAAQIIRARSSTLLESTSRLGYPMALIARQAFPVPRLAIDRFPPCLVGIPRPAMRPFLELIAAELILLPPVVERDAAGVAELCYGVSRAASEPGERLDGLRPSPFAVHPNDPPGPLLVQDFHRSPKGLEG